MSEPTLEELIDKLEKDLMNTRDSLQTIIVELKEAMETIADTLGIDK